MDNIKITTYAPILIPTLNRYEKLKRLVESLENNPLAKYTEIYISVDFPPEDRYINGYEKIKGYLNESKLKFKKVNLYFQECNLGAFRNSEFLVSIVMKKYDRFITLEDDNVVSPNFLEYMNKALEYSKDKSDIYCVSAFTGNYKLPCNITGTAFMSQFMSWGTGIFVDRYCELKHTATVEWIDDIILDWKKLYKIYKCSRTLMVHFGTHYILTPNSNFCDDVRIWPIDIVQELYMIFNDKYSIMPTTSKIRNYGNDGSGQNCISDTRQLDVERLQPLDMNNRFEFVLETDKKKMRKIQRYIRNKSRFVHSELMALEMLIYCICYVKVMKRYKSK